METNEKQVSNNIKATIKKYGYSIGGLADSMGISRQALSHTLNHPFKCNIDRLNSVATAIGCNIDEFFMPLEFTLRELERRD